MGERRPTERQEACSSVMIGRVMHAGKPQGLLIYGQKMLRNFPMNEC